MPSVEVVERVTIDAPEARVWSLLTDVREVVECVPGASLGGVREDGRYDASIGVKFGVISLRFSGVARVTYDEAARRVTLAAQGRDAARTTRAAGDVVVGVSAGASGTDLEVRGTFDFAGPTAHLAQTGARAVAGSILKSFASCLGRRVAAAQGGEA